jgi:hypothetical protein
MIETEHLKIYPASKEQMEVFIETQTVDVLKAAYTEMLNGCLDHAYHVGSFNYQVRIEYIIIL